MYCNSIWGSLTTKAPYRCVYIMRNGCFPSELLGGEAGIKCLLNAGCVPFFWPRTLVFKRVTSSDSNFLGQVWTDIIDCSLYLPSRFTSEYCMPLFPNRNILLVKCQNLTQRDHARTLIRKHVTLLLCCFACKVTSCYIKAQWICIESFHHRFMHVQGVEAVIALLFRWSFQSNYPQTFNV